MIEMDFIVRLTAVTNRDRGGRSMAERIEHVVGKALEADGLVIKENPAGWAQRRALSVDVFRIEDMEESNDD